MRTLTTNVQTTQSAKGSEGQPMIRRRIDIPIKIGWRMNADDLAAVDIDLTVPKYEAKTFPGMPDNGWLESSRDLQHGLRVHETPMDALPDDLVEAFNKTKR